MRKHGFYWVRHKDYGLLVAEYNGTDWEIPGVLYSVPESDMRYISKKRLTFGG